MNSKRLLKDKEKQQIKRVYEFGSFHLDAGDKLLFKANEVVQLPPKSCDLLLYMVTNSGRLLTKEELLECVWRDTFVEEANLSHHIAVLRKTLGEDKNGDKFIETIPRRGYRFIAPVTEIDDEIIAIITSEKTETQITVEEEITTDEIEKHAQRALPEAKPKSRAFNKILTVAICLLVVGVGVGVWRMLRSGRAVNNENQKTALILTLPGNVGGARLSPDNKFLAFSWNGDKETYSDIYVQMIGSGKPLRLTDNPASDTSPAWSNDGKTIAFIRRGEKERAIYLIPALSGQERKLIDLHNDIPVQLDWSPDGRFIAVVDSDKDMPSTQRAVFLINVAAGEKSRLTTPPADFFGDFRPKFSPDSQQIAFCRVAKVASAIYTMAVTGGEPQLVHSEKSELTGLVWDSDNQSLLYLAQNGSVTELFHVESYGGTPQKLMRLGAKVFDVQLSNDGRHLIYGQIVQDKNIWQAKLPSKPYEAIQPTKLVASTQNDEYPFYSHDGKKISFTSNRSGTSEIWLSDSDGTNPLQLTKFDGPTVTGSYWSPDNQKIAFQVSIGENLDVYWINVAGGEPKRLTDGGTNFVRHWSKDGKWIYFARRDGGKTQIWKRSIIDGSLVQVTQTDGNYCAEDAAGQWLYFSKFNEGGFWRIPVNGGNEEKLLDENELPSVQNDGVWTATNEGFYLFNPKQNTLKFFNPNTRELKLILNSKPMPFKFGFSVAPDNQTLIFARTDYISNEVVMLENFR